MALSIFFIMVIELCERTGYYTISSSKKSWLQNQGYSNSMSSALSSIFGLLSYVSCFLGGWLAETPFGRYRTILTLVACYVVGCFVAAVSTHAGVESVPLYFLGTFVLVTLGSGGIKPNVSTFGADQIDPSGPNLEERKETFFMYFYLMVNVGCVIAFGFLANVTTSGLPPLIPKEDGFFCAYVIAGALMAVAMVMFFGGTPFYRRESFQTNSESVLKPCVERLRGCSGHPLGKVAIVGWALMPVLIVVSVVQAFIPSDVLTMVSLLLDLVCIACLCAAHRSNAWMGKADAVTRCLDVVPALLIGNVAFNVLYNAMSTTFYSQSCQMDTRLGGGADAMQLNGAFFNLADAVAIIVFTPLITRFFCPAFERVTGRAFDYNLKIYAGVGAAMAAHLVAALLEFGRKNAAVLDIGSDCAPLQPNGEHVRMSGMSAFWMSIPYALIGIGEVLVNPVLQSVAYQGADPSMRSLIQAFNLFAMGGFPSAISAALTQATASFVPNDLNEGDLPLVYLINIAFGAVGCLAYYFFSGSVQLRPTQDASDSKVIGPESTKQAAAAPDSEEQVAAPRVLLGRRGPQHETKAACDGKASAPEASAPEACQV